MKYLGSPQSGSRDGVVASHNRYGQYYRTRAQPVNPQTPKQSLQRAIFGGLSTSWRTVSDADRLSWVDKVTRVNSLGQTITLSPAAAFVAINAQLVAAGMAAVDSYPDLAPSAVDALSITPTWTAGVLSIAYPVPTEAVLQVWAGLPMSTAGGFVLGWRLMGNRDSGSMSPWVATSAWTGIFGSPSVGAVSPLRARLVYGDGTLTDWIQSRPVIA